MLGWLSSPRRRVIVALVAGVATLALVVAILVKPGGTPELSPTATPSTTPSSSEEPPAAVPLPGAPGGRTLPLCGDEVVPEPASPESVAEPVGGSVSLQLLSHVGGAADAAALDGERLLVGAGSRVLVFDVADPDRPRELAVSDSLAGKVTALAVVEEVVVAGLGDEGIAVLSSTGDSLAHIASLPLPGYVEAVTMHDSIALVADGPGGLQIVDVSDPARPREMATAFDLHRIMDAAVSGDHAYLAAADEGLLVVDIDELTAPQSVGSLFTGGYASGLAVDGSFLYLADAWAGLQVMDVADPSSPRLVTTLPAVAWMTDVEIGAGRAFVAAGSDGLRVLDLANPGEPEEVGSMSLDGGLAARVRVQGDLAVVTDALHEVVVVDIGDPSAPVVRSTVAPFGTAQGVAVVGNRAFLAARDQGLRIIDVSDPRQPRENMAIVTEDLVQAVGSVGTNVFFATVPHPGGSSLHSIFGIDTTTGGALVPELPYGDGNVVGMAVSGSSLLMGIEGGLEIVHGGTASPCELGYIQTYQDDGAEATGVAASGGYAYVAVEERGVYAIDIADPRTPELVGQAPLPENFKAVHATLAAGSTLYAIGSSHFGQEVLMYDLAAPAEPRLLGTLTLSVPTLANAEDGVQPLAYADGHLFVADAGAGLLVIDVSAPPTLTVAGQVRLPGRAASVVVADGLAYVASHDGGLSIVDWTEGSAAAPVADAVTTLASAHRSGPAVDSIGLEAPGDCVVTSTADSGDGTLRDCLERAESGRTITFDPAAFPPGRPSRILLESELPFVADGVALDGAGAGVVLDGGGQVGEGLHLGSGSVIQGLTIIGFTGAGVYLDGGGNTIARNVVSGNEGAGIVMQGDDNRLVGNLIGPDPSGMASQGFQEIGLDLHGSGNVIGGPDAEDRNVIGGSRTEVWVKETRGNTIEGNYIGTDITSRNLLRPPDWNRTMYFEFGAGANLVARNVIAGGVTVGPTDPGSSYNAFVGNLVGVDASGTRALPCECSGFVVGGYTRIGGTLPGEGNLINGGIDIVGTDVVVLGNRLGMDINGRPFPFDPHASIFLHTARRNVVGGRAPGAANAIAEFGVVIADEAQANIILGNRIGAAALLTEAGVTLRSAGRNHLVANVVEHAASGLTLHQGAYSNRVRGNVFRLNEVAVVAADASDNLVSGNAFLDNGLAASDAGSGNRWDDGTSGNYWSDHTGADPDGDGIINVARDVPPLGRDNYPLLRQP